MVVDDHLANVKTSLLRHPDYETAVREDGFVALRRQGLNCYPPFADGLPINGTTAGATPVFGSD